MLTHTRSRTAAQYAGCFATVTLGVDSVSALNINDCLGSIGRSTEIAVEGGIAAQGAKIAASRARPKTGLALELTVNFGSEKR